MKGVVVGALAAVALGALVAAVGLAAPSPLPDLGESVVISEEETRDDDRADVREEDVREEDVRDDVPDDAGEQPRQDREAPEVRDRNDDGDGDDEDDDEDDDGSDDGSNG